MAKRLKLTVKLEMEPYEQAQRKQVYDALSLPEFAKDPYIYRIGLDTLLKQVKAEEAKNK